VVRAGVIGAVVVAAASTAAVAGASSGPSRLVVARGFNAKAVPGARTMGATAASTEFRISVVLKMRNQAALEAAVVSGAFHRGSFLTVNQFAARYGQPSGVVRAIASFMRINGLKIHVFRSRLAISARGTAAQIENVFGTSMSDVRLPAVKRGHGQPARPAQVAHVAVTPATLPAPLARHVLTVLGLESVTGSFQSTAIRARPMLHRAPSDVGKPPAGMLVPRDFLNLYHGNKLQAKGHGGAGQTIGIVTLAAVPVKDVFSFWKAIGLHVSPKRLQVVNVDGGPGAPSFDAGSDETSLDVEQSGAIAPRARIVVYQAPNSTAGFIDGFFAAASANRADSISASWNESETFARAAAAVGEDTPVFSAAFNLPLLEAAAQGQADFNSSGDEGAYSASGDLGSTNLSVFTPQNSPYITSAGGTTLSTAQDPQVYGLPSGKTMRIVIPRERTWGWDYLWPEFQQFGRILNIPGLTEVDWAKSNVVGSGGGVSEVFGMPPYQSIIPGISQFSAIHYLTPIAFTNQFPALGPATLPFNLPSDWAVDFGGPLVSGNGGDSRLTPDLSANADPQTGYAVFTRLFKPVFGTNWVQFGGTSFVAPQLNGVSALVQSMTGGRIGFWNPAIYRFAASAGSPFTPVNAQGSIAGTTVRHTPGTVTFTVPGSNNIFYTGRPGTRYNMGSGLGIPNLTELGQRFAKMNH
jgi:subtilase family serine protease